MPDDKRPEEDHLADLFGRLPDPRKRAVEGAESDAASRAAVPPLPASSAEDAAARQTPAEQRPLSRREMRQRAATGESPTVRPETSQPSTPAASNPAASNPAPSTPTPSNPAPVNPAAANPAAAAPQRAAQPPTQQPGAQEPPAAPPRAHEQPVYESTPRSAAGSPSGAAANGWDAAAQAGPRVSRSGSATIEATPASDRPVSTMSLDDLFAEEKRVVPSKQEKRRNRRIGGWIALGVVLVLLGGVTIGGLWVWNTYEGPIRSFMGWEEPRDFEAGQAQGEALVTIASGDGGQAISQTLYDAGVTKTPGAFYAWLLDLDSVPTFYPGVYKLQQQMTSAAALEALQNPESKLENSALIREGLTVEQTLPALAEGIGLPIEDFQAAIAQGPAAYGVDAPDFEGWLFPATYTFDPGITAVQVIQAMVDQTVRSLDAAGVPVEDRQRILTIASIIQREARETDDFYKVSRVIQNRLLPDNPETFGKLQMDSTAQYGYKEMHDGTVSTSAAALADDNAWNTYVIQGLPVGPIANPGDVAIDAAMHPVDGTWLYFVTVNLDTGETIFTDTYAQHQKAVAQWQEWCADNPNKGC